jgi:hypothetical protein
MTGQGVTGRRIARVLLFTALLIDGLVAFVLLNPPQVIGPMIEVPPSPSIAHVTIAVGVVLNVVGLVWMVRILRADPEAHSSPWRSARGR